MFVLLLSDQFFSPLILIHLCHKLKIKINIDFNIIIVFKVYLFLLLQIRAVIIHSRLSLIITTKQYSLRLVTKIMADEIGSRHRFCDVLVLDYESLL